MKILLYTQTSSNLNNSKSSIYNGGGWISSLEKALCRRKDVELAIAFFSENDFCKIKQGNVLYYPMRKYDIPFFQKIRFKCSKNGNEKLEKAKWAGYENALLDPINDFNPDIIEIFGSEECFGLVADKTAVPVVLHIQGILNPYLNAFLPPFISWKDFFCMTLHPQKIYDRVMTKVGWEVRCMREKEILRRVKHYIGRTIWDERVIKVFNPQAEYIYGSEILRDVFYIESERHIPNRLIIVTTISNPLYKGFDLILKTASLLKNEMGLDFEWKVFGNVDARFIEHKLKIQSKDVNVRIYGVVSAENLHEALLACTVYVHPSYIDNSPNSVCEAQICACPVIAANVGGISSLIEDGKSGFLVPANDPYQTAFLIDKLNKDLTLNCHIGKKAKEIARERHSKDKIVSDLMDIYEYIHSKGGHSVR